MLKGPALSSPVNHRCETTTLKPDCAGGSGESSEKQTLIQYVCGRAQGRASLASSQVMLQAMNTLSTSALDDRLANGDQREGV